MLKQEGTFKQDPETIILEVSEAIGSSLNEFHLAMESFRDAVALWMNRYPRAIFNGKSAWHMAQPFRHYFTPLFS